MIVIGSLSILGCLVFVIFISIGRTDGLDCYTCTNATHISECKSTTTCNAGEICFSDHIQTPNGILYSFGCRLDTYCKTIVAKGNNVGTGSVVGRSTMTGTCFECCKEQHCNRQLCMHSFSEKECADSTEIHCSTVGAMVDMCSDTEKANTVCRRFCGLCNYVNGQWSSWVSWSNCHVTCGTGTQTRARNCSEPAPSGGGHFCEGQSLETQDCTEGPCPVHGSWAGWTPWGSCSATCGIGLQRRDRSCSNPYPARFGDHCYGDSRDDQICLTSACSDGGWADWTVWGTCSRTCGDGIKTRSRTCDNPLPSIQGKYCQGDPYQVVTCSLKGCPETNGGWSTWTEWTHCSATCNTGMRSRLRDCDSPVPSAGGKFCPGSSYDVQQCIIKSCPRKLSAFTAKQPSNGYCSHPTFWASIRLCYISFKNVVLNEGNHYNDGDFTCLYPGLYYFEAYLTARNNGRNTIECEIQKNSLSVIDLNQVNPGNSSNGTLSTTGSTTLHLVKGDVVHVYCTHDSSYLHSTSAFSGFLVSPDP
ncbi:A disintegrin and metalloproteinase with thrombospondin motifs adt-1-like [Mercenaria mercenaria]|uniref:A disintegrin and metalloproteinase with thrombospondin motifs adt-1-like n=1 Tax=Mercenaria mercenaria TaxID=6596 RepID=UPI00234E9378|nr:A disintegrin and metalloproteinase with thrombospondin motifs adt-1-like [Mercenaria mercenaria]